MASFFSFGFNFWKGFLGRAAARNTRHLLQIARDVPLLGSKRMLFACFPFLHMALHGMAGRGGVYVRGLPGFLYLDLSMNGVHVALTTRVHVKS